jgi:hypothetical protein
MKTELRRACPSCGNEFSGAVEFCPVCILRKALGDGVESGESSASEDTVKPTPPEQALQRFEHYELVTGEDGKPIELGRGAMGVTYKAFDVDLRCPVTLKVISERYLGDESARLRFLREARAAASVRHPNVASVFHLGRTGSSYFYAMEFVEGETLEHLIRRSGRIEMQSALDITTQVATGLAAVHEQNLVHWDIKPSNIMVNQNGAYYLNRNNHTGSQLSQVDVHNPNTNCTSTAVLPLDDLPPSPRQFQKLVFSQAQGDENTLSAGKTNLCTTWKEFLADVEKMPVVEYSELHIDNSDEGWLE